MTDQLINFLIEYAKEHLDFDASIADDIHHKMRHHVQINPLHHSITSIQEAIQVMRHHFNDLPLIEQDRMIDQVFMWLTEPQHQVNHRFWMLHQESPEKATRFLFGLGQANYYIQSEKIAKNRRYDVGDLIVTINLSKEEKDNKDIAKALKAKPVTFPKCVLCYENVGYLGKSNQPPRGTLRVAEMKLGGQDWFMQYSPYPYFHEHAIFIDKIHRPMTVNRTTLVQLFDIVELFPDYFVGSNAALPIVGGSILSHAHFQGGHNIMFPMMKAKPIRTWECTRWPNVNVETIEWPATVLRLTSADKEPLIDFAHRALRYFETYQNPALGIVPKTGDTPHHAMAPILYKKDHEWILHLVFRSNLTNAIYPDGIFHAHPEYHHIKKEGIGLIEAMGMFILPGRLAPVMDEFMEAQSYEDLLILAEKAPIHQSWLLSTFESFDFLQDEKEKKQAFLDALRNVCWAILDNIALFKKNTKEHEHETQFYQALLTSMNHDE